MINWHMLLINLKRTGMSVPAIAKETGIDEHRLYRIRKGGAFRLDLEDVIALTDLHYDRCEDRHKALLIE